DAGQWRDDHAELVSAQPGECSGRAHAWAEAGRELAQYVIAGLVTEAVIDLLEPVEIDQDDGELRRSAPVFDASLKGFVEEPAVREPGEFVRAGLAPGLGEDMQLPVGVPEAGDGNEQGQHREHDAEGEEGLPDSVHGDDAERAEQE